jgi:hypothetical protein
VRFVELKLNRAGRERLGGSEEHKDLGLRDTIFHFGYQRLAIPKALAIKEREASG